MRLIAQTHTSSVSLIDLILRIDILTSTVTGIPSICLKAMKMNYI